MGNNKNKHSGRVSCSACNAFISFALQAQLKNVLALPDVLALNCQLENPRDLEFWKIQLMVGFKSSCWLDVFD